MKTAHAETWNGHNRLNPDKRGRQLRKIIPHLPAKVHEGLFFMFIIRNDERYQHPEACLTLAH